MIVVLDKIINALDKGDFVLGVFLDFSKAFDTVNHNILLAKLDFYGIRGIANLCIIDYLSNRSQYVSYNGATSTHKHIKCGVPQGSILGPILFLSYINDLAHVSKELFFLMYADDTNVFLNGSNVSKLADSMNFELHLPVAWLRANKLSLTLKKNSVHGIQS